MIRLPHLMPLAALAIAAQAQAGAPQYQVLQRLPLGGEGGWDYPSVDPASHLLYLSRGDHVSVVDTVGGREAGSIAGTPGTHGIALAPELNRGWISAGKADQVKVFDLKTRAVLSTVATGAGPDAIVYEPVNRRVFAFNGRGRSATVIDAVSDQVLATIPLGGRPEFARADGRGRVLVNIEDTAELLALDARQNTVAARWPLPGCDGPGGLALDPGHQRSFSTCDNQALVVMDIEHGKPVARVPIGSKVDGAEFDPGSDDVYSANGEGTLTVVHEDTPDRYTVRQTLPTQVSARTIALDGATHRLYLPAAELGPPPAATPENPHPRPSIKPGTFAVLVVGINQESTP